MLTLRKDPLGMVRVVCLIVSIWGVQGDFIGARPLGEADGIGHTIVAVMWWFFEMIVGVERV